MWRFFLFFKNFFMHLVCEGLKTHVGVETDGGHFEGQRQNVSYNFSVSIETKTDGESCAGWKEKLWWWKVDVPFMLTSHMRTCTCLQVLSFIRPALHDHGHPYTQHNQIPIAPAASEIPVASFRRSFFRHPRSASTFCLTARKQGNLF